MDDLLCRGVGYRQDRGEVMTTLEQQARDLLERIGVEDAQSFTAGDLVELANIIGQAARAAPAQPAKTAKQRYDELEVAAEEPDPVERLRAFCSFAMTGDDWLDVEPFFDAIKAPAQPNSNAECATRNMVPGNFPTHAGGITGNVAALAQRDLTVPEEKALDAALFAGSKTVSPQTSDGSHWAIKAPARPAGERVLLMRKSDQAFWHETLEQIKDDSEYAWATIEPIT
jgi:hypothetical protein